MPIPEQKARMAFEKMLLDDYAPPSAVVDERGDTLFLGGQISQYLQPAGSTAANLLEAACGSLRIELPSMLGEAVRAQAQVVRDDVCVELRGATFHLRVTVRPLPPLETEARLYAVVLQERSFAKHVEAGEAAPASPEPPALEPLDPRAREEWLLRRIQEISHLGSWELDLQRNHLFWSDEVYRIFGLEPQEFAASYEAFLDAVHPDDRAKVDSAYSGSLREGRDSYEVEHRVVRKSTGEVRVVHEKCEHLRDATGRIVKSVGMVHDITERKATELRLAYLATIPEKDPCPIVEADQDGRVRYANPAALRLFPDVRELGSAHPWLSDWESTVRAFREGSAVSKARVVTIGDRSYHQDLVFAPEEGVVRAYGLDITQAKRTEMALRLANERLEDADRRKNQFLAMLSHELRNPLAPIRNSLYILDRAAPGGEQARRAQAVIGRQIEHLTHLVDDLLDVTRISRGKIQLQRERVDLVDIVRCATDDHRSHFTANHLELEITIPEDSIWIDGDRTRIAQVIGNLLQNASKFTPAGGKVSISLQTDATAGQAIVRVRDNGAGIAPEMLPRVFEPFTQADTTLDRSKGGLGLGLSLVKGLVELHGGCVAIASEGLGKGTELTVRFPINARRVEAPAPDPGANSHRGSSHILIIEDNLDTAESLRELLELDGHVVETACSGPEGVEKAQALKPDVVLCDIGLPGMDGFEVGRRIRANPGLRRTALVALTGYAAPEDIAHSREAGFDVHLAKPPSIEKIEQVLASRMRTASNASAPGLTSSAP
ncbi:MAG: response regulator [Deltaproteobacteria bacterium]|nr:response regulator [Deltaproteobacteria bacterium]